MCVTGDLCSWGAGWGAPGVLGRERSGSPGTYNFAVTGACSPSEQCPCAGCSRLTP